MTVFDSTLLMELGNFSRLHCVAICATLVPCNLLATVATLGCWWQRRSATALYTSAAIASLSAILLCLHIFSWFVIGIVTPVTFILGTLALVCLSCNGLVLYLNVNQALVGVKPQNPPAYPIS